MDRNYMLLLVKIIVVSLMCVFFTSCNDSQDFYTLDSLPEEVLRLEGKWQNGSSILEIKDGHVTGKNMPITSIDSDIITYGDFDFPLLWKEWASGVAIVRDSCDPLYLKKDNDYYFVHHIDVIKGRFVEFRKIQDQK